MLAVPHILLLAALGGAARWTVDTGDSTTSVPLGLVTVGVAIAGLSLLFTGRYPRGLHDLLVGVARWNLRVIAYLTLLPGDYPPFRLDQGDRETDDGPTGPARAGEPATPAGPPSPARADAAARDSAADAAFALVTGAVARRRHRARLVRLRPGRAGWRRPGPAAQRARVRVGCAAVDARRRKAEVPDPAGRRL